MSIECLRSWILSMRNRAHLDDFDESTAQTAEAIGRGVELTSTLCQYKLSISKVERLWRILPSSASERVFCPIFLSQAGTHTTKSSSLSVFRGWWHGMHWKDKFLDREWRDCTASAERVQTNRFHDSGNDGIQILSHVLCWFKFKSVDLEGAEENTNSKRFRNYLVLMHFGRSLRDPQTL